MPQIKAAMSASQLGCLPRSWGACLEALPRSRDACLMSDACFDTRTRTRTRTCCHDTRALHEGAKSMIYRPTSSHEASKQKDQATHSIGKKIGPFQIIQKMSRINYRPSLQGSRMHPAFHVSLLIPVPPNARLDERTIIANEEPG